MSALKVETIAVLGVALAAVYLLSKAKDVVSDVASDAWDVASTKLNPVSDQNVAYQGVNSIGAWLSGNNKFDLGSSVYDVTHDGTLNPTSDNNIIYRNVSSWLGGDLGSKIYDWTH